jgi:hypothetical protein
MNVWSRISKYINAGTPLVLMGALWLYLWVFPWYDAYVYDNYWGYNYTLSLAFLAVGLAYFSRRFISNLLGFLAALLIIPTALELLPHSVTAITGGVLVGLIILDTWFERGRKDDLAQPSNRRLSFWLKRHLPFFSYIMLGHLAFIHFLVNLPDDTYEAELVTMVYNGMSVVFLILVILEQTLKQWRGISVARMSFFWGMLTMLVSFFILLNQSENWSETWAEIWICVVIVVLVSALGIAALVNERRSAAA